jgi:hypothetical protein
VNRDGYYAGRNTTVGQVNISAMSTLETPKGKTSVETTEVHLLSFLQLVGLASPRLQISYTSLSKTNSSPVISNRNGRQNITLLPFQA